MADNIKGIPFNSDDEGTSFTTMARLLVFERAYNQGGANDVVVWFAYVLGYWKALVSTSLPDGKYYEVTYNRQSESCYVDTYVKTNNEEVKMKTFPRMGPPRKG